MNILTIEQLMSKIDHFSAVSSLISFTSLSLIKRYLNSTCRCAIVNNSKITLLHIQLLKFLVARNKSIKFDPCYFSNTFLFFLIKIFLRMLDQRSDFARLELIYLNLSIIILIKILASMYIKIKLINFSNVYSSKNK